LIRKEFLQVIRDPSSVGIALVLPIILLLLFGYGVSLDAKRVPVAIVVELPGAAANRFVSRFAGSEYFQPVSMQHMAEAIEALRVGRVDGIVRLRGSFGKHLHTPRETSIQLIVDGVDANTARLIQGYVQGVWNRWLAAEARSRGQPLSVPVAVEQRVWFNAEVRSRNFIVPGIVAVVMTLIGALLTALVMAREWERGTMEALLATPVRSGELLLGKIVPYFVLGMGGMALSVAMGIWLFQVPLRGSWWVLFGSGAMFLLVALGMGLLISSLARNQFVAAQAAIIVTFLPAFILSGFIFDIGSMPEAIQWVTRVIPARYFVSILQTVFLAGDLGVVVLPNLLSLALMAVLLLGLTRWKTRKRLQ
jgi:ABC-2 type transport system permease protein